MARTHRCLGALVLLATACVLHAEAATVVLSCGSVGQELQICQGGAAAWRRETGHDVIVVASPGSATERLALYQQVLAAGSPDIDAYAIDVIWPGLLASHFIDLARRVDPAALEAHFPAIIAASTVRGRLVALPLYTDAALLFYRADLLDKYGLRPPATWDELAAQATQVLAAERATGNRDLQGFVWQGKAYEGLTVNALEWIASSGGGTIVEADGTITIDNPGAVQAVQRAAAWVGGISPTGVLNYAEEEARGVFQSGRAVFMRNWPYAWALAQGEGSPVRGKVGVVPLPTDGAANRPRAVLGGWQLAVSKYSRNQEAAIALVTFLTGAAEQKRHAVAYGYQPTIPALYRDPEVLRALPFQVEGVFDTAVARPSRATGALYNQASSQFFNAVHAVLEGHGSAQERLAALARQLERLSRGGRW
ncbi:putative ABC transporter-binding protein DR_1438 [Rhodovastum atsumiense]|uniref:ABC transporter substrate-binding protein n=1 Tax=Rhodovastum atsumiense TaxID=504468 RepID=A0A5M6ISU0_9PROT|nr:ABC transporter substrate-binding protein [Rhodovastum atsumiense]KAA5610907.1 ABC transporter substrate-binding protein [Rhodovastum atsumiense]CAH2601526.1 putative ABC transporter-binding protein DR_1438 [Rhodovastum atsumiense]